MKRDIDIEELKTLRVEAAGKCDCYFEAEPCKVCKANGELAYLAPRLAARVVADAALLREVREALEARSRAYHELHPGHFTHPDSPTASYNACTKEPCVGDRATLAKLKLKETTDGKD